MSTVKVTDLAQGIRLLSMDASRFKTNHLTVKIERPLRREEATFNALLPYVLESGCRRFPTRLALYRRMQEMYAANISVCVTKAGERQFLNFNITFPAEIYVSEGILKESAVLLMEVIFDPALEEGIFRSEILEVEKEALREAILGRMNDKGAYAMERCVEIMCQKERFGVCEDGYIEDLERITAQDLYHHYKAVLAHSPMDILFASQESEEKLIPLILPWLTKDRGDILPRVEDQRQGVGAEVKRHKEGMDVAQGKLVMGFRLDPDLEAKEYEALILYNGILGSGPHSKLFRNVREKNSLCYSVYSFADRLKGLFFVCAGIDSEKVDLVEQLVQQEMENMRELRIEEEELQKALAVQSNVLKGVEDDLGNTAGFYYAQLLQGTKKSPEQMIQALHEVTLRQIADVGRKIHLDTVYFLSPEEAQR